jgi:hypothetical protein
VELFPALRWRFTEVADIEAYGDGWRIYDEAVLNRLPGRDLIAIEEAIDGTPVRKVMREFREGSTLGQMAAMWITLHREGHEVTWPDFNPVVFASDWEVVRADPLDSGEDPKPDSASSDPATPSEESATSS